jgi:hypothetical protein
MVVQVAPKRKITLDDVGTRYAHLTDLLDVWSSAIEVFKASYARVPNATDRIRITELEHVVKYLEGNILSMMNTEVLTPKLKVLIESLPKPDKVKIHAEKIKEEEEKSKATGKEAGLPEVAQRSGSQDSDRDDGAAGRPEREQRDVPDDEDDSGRDDGACETT